MIVLNLVVNDVPLYFDTPIRLARMMGYSWNCPRSFFPSSSIIPSSHIVFVKVCFRVSMMMSSCNLFCRLATYLGGKHLTTIASTSVHLGRSCSNTLSFCLNSLLVNIYLQLAPCTSSLVHVQFGVSGVIAHIPSLSAIVACNLV